MLRGCEDDFRMKELRDETCAILDKNDVVRSDRFIKIQYILNHHVTVTEKVEEKGGASPSRRE